MYLRMVNILGERRRPFFAFTVLWGDQVAPFMKFNWIFCERERDLNSWVSLFIVFWWICELNVCSSWNFEWIFNWNSLKNERNRRLVQNLVKKESKKCDLIVKLKFWWNFTWILEKNLIFMWFRFHLSVFEHIFSNFITYFSIFHLTKATLLDM